MVYSGQITLGEFVKVNSLIMLVYGPIQWFGELNQWFSRAMGGAERILSPAYWGLPRQTTPTTSSAPARTRSRQAAAAAGSAVK